MESLLTSLVGHDLVSGHDVAVTCDEVEAGLRAQPSLVVDDSSGPATPQGTGTSVPC